MKKYFLEFWSAVKADFKKWRESCKDPKTVRRTLFHTLILLLVIGLCGGILILSLSAAIVDRGSSRVQSHEQIDALIEKGGEYDCILVLGCGVKADGTPSDRLYDRVKVGVDLYHAGVAPKILMSGDHGQEHYDEVSTMLALATQMGVPEEDVFLDHAGFSTYESVYRADYIFDCDRMVIVTQDYHLYRALHIAESFGIAAEGVSADLRPYQRMLYHNCRETLARAKDFFFSLTKPDPTYLGNKIDLSGDGSVTHGGK